MNGYMYVGPNVQEGTPEPLISSIEKGTSFKDEPWADKFTGTIVFVCVSGLCASAAVEETGYAGTISFADYFHLMKMAMGRGRSTRRCRVHVDGILTLCIYNEAGICRCRVDVESDQGDMEGK